MARRTPPLCPILLEDRTVPSSGPIPWPDPGRITISFAPDGTRVADAPSTLFQTFDQIAPTRVWQFEILEAFQTWAVHANFNVGLVSDNGQGFGVPGAPQGDVRFGDIRVGAKSLEPDHLAASSPFTWIGSTWGGDILFNGAAAYSVDSNSSKSYDLYTVALHEAGHALGLQHSADPASVMYESYEKRVSLTSDDIAGIQSLYGAREHDEYDAKSANNTRSTALSLPDEANVLGDITTDTDVDWYKFKVKGGTTGTTVRLLTSGYSLLTGKLSLYNSSGKLISSVMAGSPLNGDLELSLGDHKKDATYFVKVDGVKDWVFRIGAYNLQIVSHNETGSTSGSVLDPQILDDAHTDDTLNSAYNLPKKETVGTNWDYFVLGVVRDSYDRDFYKLKSDKVESEQTQSMVVMVWATGASNLDPGIRVFDADGLPVAYSVLTNQGTLYSIQVESVVANSNYYLDLGPSTAGDEGNTGHYSLAIAFHQSGVDRPISMTGGLLVETAPTTTDTFNLNRDKSISFSLAAFAGSNVLAAVELTVTDSFGNVVFTLTARAGEPLSTYALYLSAGTYYFHYAARSYDGSPLSGDLNYALYARFLSDGIGPYKTDSTETTTSESDSDSTDSGYTYESDSSTEAPPPSEIYYL